METTHNDLDILNPAQRAAVTAPPQHMLVLAGAGSGKTRVLVQRIVWLVNQLGVSPERILAVTFTNKAAGEMRQRLETLLHVSLQYLWIGTFHGMAHRLLRRHWQAVGLPQSFQVIDNDDQLRLVKRVLKTLNLDEERWPAKQAQWFINQKKEEGLRPQQVRFQRNDKFAAVQVQVYEAYEGLCRNSGLVDFAELLLRSYELLNTDSQILTHYQQRFEHILVDEFQDTNQLQYRWLKLLAGDRSKLMMVGDDDQSIYSWRGAKVEHLNHFVTDFPDVITLRLEQNYRSTSVILKAANAIISHNTQRLGKNLWTSGDDGDPIELYSGFNDREEARFIVGQMKEWVAQGGGWQDLAVLYRSNAQSRVLEDELIRVDVPYRIYGGLRFFERAEIKDGLAYLRLLTNRADDAAFERVINTPARGIGENTLAALRQYAKDAQLSLYAAAQALVNTQALPARAQGAVSRFIALIEAIAEKIASPPLSAGKDSGVILAQQTQYVLENSGLLALYREDRSEKGQSRVENLEELISATRQFSPEGEEVQMNPMTAFLARVVLDSGEHQADTAKEAVHLMTLHAAKGLEFPVVFLSGMEEGLFPHGLSSQNPPQLEEERRLCYVGMTRAMKHLYLTYAENRVLHGREMHQRPSRFLKEIPEKLLSKRYLKSKISRPAIGRSINPTQPPPKATVSVAATHPFGIGKRVKHPHFGKGVVLNHEGSGDHARIQIRFADGPKWLVVNYAKLEMLS